MMTKFRLWVLFFALLMHACIAYSFSQLDAVFGDDCKICSVNLKIMWCMYTCGPTKGNYVKPLGYQYSPEYGYYYAMTNFTVDPNYACTEFTSCEKTSFISEASVTSSEQFLDFLVMTIQ